MISIWSIPYYQIFRSLMVSTLSSLFWGWWFESHWWLIWFFIRFWRILDSMSDFILTAFLLVYFWIFCILYFWNFVCGMESQVKRSTIYQCNLSFRVTIEWKLRNDTRGNFKNNFSCTFLIKNNSWISVTKIIIQIWQPYWTILNVWLFKYS